jgi:hypothetical protein
MSQYHKESNTQYTWQLAFTVPLESSEGDKKREIRDAFALLDSITPAQGKCDSYMSQPWAKTKKEGK